MAISILGPIPKSRNTERRIKRDAPDPCVNVEQGDAAVRLDAVSPVHSESPRRVRRLTWALSFKSLCRTDRRPSLSSQLSMAVGVAQLGNTRGRPQSVDCVTGGYWLLAIVKLGNIRPTGAA
jgi:hypothetical protein